MGSVSEPRARPWPTRVDAARRDAGRASAPRPDALKIALVSPYDFAYPGGVTSHVAHLADQFRARGHLVHIIAPSSETADEPAFGNHIVHRIGRVVRIPANGSVARITLSLRSWLQTKRLLRDEQYDLIHLHEPMIPALPLTVLRHSQSVNIGTFHAFRSRPLAYFYGKPILQPFFRKLHGHVAVSPAARDFIGEYFRTEYRVIPNGIEFGRFCTAMPLLDRFADSRPNVLFVGRLEKRKGLKFLLRAWPRVLEQVPGARLIVVGEGRPLVGYKRYARRKGWTDDDVHFAGYVSEEEKPRYFQVANVFCAPSTGQESFGIVLLEAMAAGAPIVATDIPGYRDVVTHGQEGLLVAPKDEEALAQALARLLQDAETRMRMGGDGRDKARRYDWSRVADQVLEYYAEVLERQAKLPAGSGSWYARMRRFTRLFALSV